MIARSSGISAFVQPPGAPATLVTGATDANPLVHGAFRFAESRKKSVTRRVVRRYLLVEGTKLRGGTRCSELVRHKKGRNRGMIVAGDTILRKRAGVVSRSLGDARIAVRLDGSETFVFNRAADLVWDRFDGQTTVATVAATCGIALDVLATFAAELIALNLFEGTSTALVSALAASAPKTVHVNTPACAVATTDATEIPLEAPCLLAREELQVLGGCTSSSMLCNMPSSSIGNGHGNGPPKPPPGLNK